MATAGLQPHAGIPLRNKTRMNQPPSDDTPLQAHLDKLEQLMVRQSMVLQNLADESRRSHSATVALFALAQALIESHPAPADLAHSFLDQMDTIGSALPSHQVEMYREDVQRINHLIMQAVNRKNPPGDT